MVSMSVDNESGILKVTELSYKIKALVERDIKDVKVKGEVVSPKIPASGHRYFSLKDDYASIDCVVWKNVKIDIDLSDGMQVVCYGYVSCHIARSKYQIIVQKVIPDGIGSMMLHIEQLKQKLIFEGLCKSDDKLSISKFPNIIGIITSATGSVIHDMLHRLRDRYPCKVLFYDASVQGDTAADEIIQGLNALKQKTDVIIIARGGGSFEDLLCFSNESLVRTIAVITKEYTPIVTGIGHETDTTLCDYVSSMRAPTPTAAIEMITPHKEEILKQLEYTSDMLLSSLRILLDGKEDDFKDDFVFGDLRYKWQDLDYLNMDFDAKIGSFINQSIKVLEHYDLIEVSVDRYDMIVQSIRSSVSYNLQHLYQKKIHDLDNAANVFEALSYKSTLKRGYCIAKSDSKILTGDTIDGAEFFYLTFYNKTVKIIKR